MRCVRSEPLGNTPKPHKSSPGVKIGHNWLRAEAEVKGTAVKRAVA